MKTKVGFIGLGLMGEPMAKNVLKSGFPLTVYNRTPSKTKELRALGSKIAKSPADLASKVDVLITMVTGPDDVKEILFSKNGVISKAKRGLIVIDMSTIGPTAAKEIGKKLESYGVGFLDAPVTGSTPKAITGELIIFIGGKKSVYEEAKPVLLSMGKNLHYMGETGMGQAIKLINNHLIAAGVVALVEGILLADAMKLSRQKLAQGLNMAHSMSPAMNLQLPNLVENKFPLRFSVANYKKDLYLASFELKKNKKKLKILEYTEKLFKKAVKENLGDEDFSAIIKVIEKK